MASPAQQQAQETTVIVNGRPKTVTTKEVSFQQTVSLAYDGNPPTGPDWEFTVTFRKGDDSKKEGTLTAGQSVKVKEGMVFNVVATNKS